MKENASGCFFSEHSVYLLSLISYTPLRYVRYVAREE